MHPSQKASQNWESNAIDKCQNDPEFMKLGLCPVCVCSHPCICTQERVARKMKEHFDKYPRGNIEAAKSRSWGGGDPIHELMLDLLKIAQEELT